MRKLNGFRTMHAPHVSNNDDFYQAQALDGTIMIAGVSLWDLGFGNNRELLRELNALPSVPEFQCRFKWRGAGSIALYDNVRRSPATCRLQQHRRHHPALLT